MFNLLWNKPKPERFSLENLKKLCAQLKQFTGDANEENIITCLKELTQLLIWGDQHDPLLLEHFFEEEVHSHFLKILQSKHNGSLIVQVLQTLNIMFENVRSQESLYFLLSKNYVNDVIGLKYDFSNDEILAYYIYLLRTLSFKLSKDTIYFFFNEQLDDFPLYSEAIKFFNHEESMIRIAVRVITLNVYSVKDSQMQDFILDRTTKTYFSNLVWFIGDYGTTINDMLQHPGEGDHSRINYYLAEHMDCFYYVNDIIELEVPKINKILISSLLNRLMRPVYLDSLLPTGALLSSTNKSASSPKLMPLVALSLMLHAFHVLKHAPLVSALASTLFSNQHYSSHTLNNNNSSNTSKAHPHSRQITSPLVTGTHSASPESSHPASPVTSKFHSFGLLGTSPANQDSYISNPNTTTPHVHLNHHNFTSQSHNQSLGTSMLQQQLQHQQQQQQQQQQQNPYKTAIYEHLSNIDSDRMVLPVLTLVYLAGRNTGVMSDVLLATDIYPQRLLKSRLLMGNLTSSAPPPTGKNALESTAMSRERSNDSILSSHSTGTTGARNISSPAARSASSLNGSLFGAAGSATAARMKTRTDSPLFEIDENIESRETEELLASKDSESDLSPESNGASASSRHPVNSTPKPLAKSPFMTKGNSDDEDVLNKPKSSSGTRRVSKSHSMLSASEEPIAKNDDDGNDMGQELRPVNTSARDRQITSIYPSTDEESEPDEERTSGKATTSGLEQDFGTPPPLPPRRQSEEGLKQQLNEDEAGLPQESISTQAAPTIQNREELIDRLMDIICGQPDSGAHRFRIITIQMAMELLIEFVFTKGVVAGKEGGVPGNNSVAQQAAENQLGEERLHRLALAEVQFRDRVQKGIRTLERKKRGESTKPPPLGILTGKVERSLTESKLGIDKQIVNIIAESAMIYGPDKDLDKEPDLDPDPSLMALFGLDPEYTSIKHESNENDNASRDQPPSSSSTGLPVREGKRARIRSRIKSKMQGDPAPQTTETKPEEQPNRLPQSKLSGLQRLEAMVIRYIKWLHILVQCRQLLCRKAITPAMTLLGLHTQPTVATSYFDDPGSGSGKVTSPTISIVEASEPKSPLLERRPSDLMSVGSTGTVVSAHKGPQKALATTATTTATALTGESGSEAGGNENSRPISSSTSSPTTVADSINNTTPPSISSSVSSISSSSVLGAGAVSATLSQPASGTASGRIIGSRALLSATAALEAAAVSANHAHASGAGQGSGSSVSHHPFINDMLTNHLDPLSASVSEALRKSGAKLKKSVVDPLATNTNLFKYTPSMMTNGQRHDPAATTSTSAPIRGFYRPPSAISSANSSVVSLVRPGSMGMRRSNSDSSSSSSHSASVKVPLSVDGGYKSTTGSSVGRNSEDHITLNGSSSSAITSKLTETEDDEGFLSILDAGHPGHQMDDQVFRILETLGLVTSSV